MLTPSTGPGRSPRLRARSASRAATASAPSLLKPIRFSTARSSTRRKSRGPRVAGLGATGDGADLDVAEAQRPQRVDADRVLVEAGREPQHVGEDDAQRLHGSPGHAQAQPSTGAAARTAAEARVVGPLGVDPGRDPVEEQPVGAHGAGVGPQRGRPVLQGAHTDVAAPHRLDALHRRAEALHRGQARHVGHHRRGADLVAVETGVPAAAGAVRRVDDQLDLAVVDQLHGGPLTGRARCPRSACAPRWRPRRCGAAPRRCPGWRGSRSPGRRAP